MLSSRTSSAQSLDDTALVTASLAGDRDAFGEIVARYQSLVCSLAYNATGSLRQSEDLAQETFVEAWRDLGQLREASKLRSWLCGIVRHRISRAFVRSAREPAHAADPLDAAPELAAPDPLPSEQAITREEQAILWRALEQIPESYREPLILFYRENHSIERVAAALDLTEDAVKQRLSRGRKLLHEQVAAFVEGALQRTAPGAAFTTSVLSALPALTAPAAMTAFAKGGAAAKALTTSTVAGAMVGPVVGALGSWLGYRASLDQAESERERQLLRKLALLVLAVAVGFAATLVAGIYYQLHGSPSPVLLPVLIVVLNLGYCGALTLMIFFANKCLHRIRTEEAPQRPRGTPTPPKAWMFRSYDYRSRRTFLGLPLVHIRQQVTASGKPLPAIGWVAIGNVACSPLFACGAFACAPISLGGIAAGLLTIAGAGFGVFSFAGVAIGVWAVGGAAVGYLASGGVALGWLAAQGGMAVAHEFAIGGQATAPHANDALAQAFVEQRAFFHAAEVFAKNSVFLLLLPLIVIAGQWFGRKWKR